MHPAAATIWHLGALHPVEQVLTLVLAFGPFLVLAAVIGVRRRRDAGDAENTRDTEEDRAPGEFAQRDR